MWQEHSLAYPQPANMTFFAIIKKFKSRENIASVCAGVCSFVTSFKRFFSIFQKFQNLFKLTTLSINSSLTLSEMSFSENLRAGEKPSRSAVRKHAISRKIFCPLYMKFCTYNVLIISSKC